MATPSAATDCQALPATYVRPNTVSVIQRLKLSLSINCLKSSESSFITDVIKGPHGQDVRFYSPHPALERLAKYHGLTGNPHLVHSAASEQTTQDDKKQALLAADWLERFSFRHGTDSAKGLVEVLRRQPVEEEEDVLADDEPVEHQAEVIIRVVSTPVESVVAFVDAPDSVFAAGIQVIAIAVRISSELSDDDRKVTFTTTDGEFIFAPEGDNQTRVVEADADNMASVFLRAPDESGEALVTATVKGFSQETMVRIVPAPADSVLRFSAFPETAPADGNTLAELAVAISPELRGAESRTVDFETTHGTFVGLGASGPTARVTADATNRATAFLRSPSQLAEALVTVRLKGFVQEEILRFDWAGPDTIAVTVAQGRTTLFADEQLRVEAELVREEGRSRVTEELEVVFEAADSLGQRLDSVRFANVTRVDTLGRSEAIFTPDDTPYRGKLTITARPSKVKTDVRGTVEVEIIDR